MNTEIGTSVDSSIVTVPELDKDHKYHVFISYSSGDSIWVLGLIHKLEKTFPSMKICFHERDFVPGKTIIDNMVECIQSSQKTVMVLSPDFVHSRWCLFEANLSLLQDCIVHKDIVPIMLKPCTLPLHLSHLTYLETDDEQFFDKLSQVLLSNNDPMARSLIHYQSSLLYSGKTLLTLTAVNEESESWQPGVFSSSPVPDSLRAVVDNPQTYKQAIEIINEVKPPKSCLRYTACVVLICALCLVLAPFCITFTVAACFTQVEYKNAGLGSLIFLPIAITAILAPIIFIKTVCWNKQEAKRIRQKMKMKTCQANLLLYDSSLLVGCTSKSQLFFVYIKLFDCMRTFQTAFGYDNVLTKNMWEKAISIYSSDYAVCLAKKHFPFTTTEPPGHLKDGICFCQYINTQLAES
ncbi:uncharacterized protein [Pyxicephalus adspersus]|uniref:uncharacterized protein n=1 Tax=Pyxicephalus adspersus TaxID=30357 RepID=UPI003B5B8D2D